MTPDLSEFLPFAGYEGAPSPVRFVGLLVASTLLDAAVLHLLLFGRRRPGDLFHGSTALFEEVKDDLRALLSRLRATGGVYFAFGDVDQPDRVLPLLDAAGIRVLENEVVDVQARGWTVAVAGVERDCDTEEARRVIERLETAPGGTDVRILLAHHPDVVKRLEPDSRIDLTVAGHTHGGQVAVPFLGPPVTLSMLPRRVAAGGLHEVSGNRLYVSRGVGLERSQAPRIRFLAPPEVSLLLLHRTARPRER